MTRISSLTAALLLGVGLVFQAGASASEKQPVAKVAKSAGASAALTAGEVLRIDKAAGTVTIKHGAMPKFDMPPMAMPYRVKDKSVLDRLKPGEKIAFDVEAIDGVFTLTRLEKVK